MKRLILLFFAIGILVSGCLMNVPGNLSTLKDAQINWEYARKAEVSNMARLREIKISTVNRGYITIDELNEALKIKGGPVTLDRRPGGITGYGRVSHPGAPGTFTSKSPEEYRREVFSTVGHGLYEEASSLFTALINNELLPFKPLLYLELEKEDYTKAEIVRTNWEIFLRSIQGFFINVHSSRAYTSWSNNYNESESIAALEKTRVQLHNISIPFDPILIKLRREFIQSVNEKRWDDANKIQNIITQKVNEITPSKVVEKVVDKQTPGGNIVVVQQPSEQHIKVEQIPRYGVSDYARVLSIMGGKQINPKDAATLKLFDMLIGR